MSKKRLFLIDGNSFCYRAYYAIRVLVNSKGQVIDDHWATPFDPRGPLYSSLDIHQQALFWQSTLMRRVGMIDRELVFCMDRDFIIRLIWNGKVKHTTKYLGMFRVHDAAKSAAMQDVRRRERETVRQRYRHYHATVLPAWIWRVYLTARRRVLIVKEAGLAYTLSKLRRKFNRRASVGIAAKRKH